MKQATSNPTDVLAMMNKLQERLFIMDQKLNTLVNRSAAPQGAKPPEKPHNHQPIHPKQIYSAICADCQKECSIPFKPSGDRPVYCQECYGRRRSGQAPKPQSEPPRDVIRAEDPVKPKTAKKKVAAKKAAAPKKKTTAKKK